MKHAITIAVSVAVLSLVYLLSGCNSKTVETPSGWRLKSFSFLESHEAKELGAYYADPNGINVGLGVQGYKSEPTLDEIVAWLRARGVR